MSTTIWHPELFQGRRTKAPYFEGWYFKQIDNNGRMFAVIPGIQKEKGKSSAFIQLLYGSPPRSKYFWFPYESFKCSPDSMDISIADCRFSDKGLSLRLEDEDGRRYSGELEFSDMIRLETGMLRPGIMSWYQYVPRMECLHGLISINHDVSGSLNIDGEDWPFKASPGYIEKDWGRSFPQAWIWTQSNSFEQSPGTSVMLSVANIPWLGKYFTGFLGFIYHQNQLYRFGSYTGHTISRLVFSDEGAEIGITGKKTSIDFSLIKGKAAILKAPAEGRMIRDVEESTTGRISFRLKFADGRPDIEAEGVSAGAEIVGDTDLLLLGLR